MDKDVIKIILKNASRAFLNSDIECLYLDSHFKNFAIPLFQKEIVKSLIAASKEIDENNLIFIHNFIVSPEYAFIHFILNKEEGNFFNDDIRKEFDISPDELRQQSHLYSMFEDNGSYWNREDSKQFIYFLNQIPHLISDKSKSRINEYLMEDFYNVDKRGESLKKILKLELQDMETFYYKKISIELLKFIPEELINLSKINYSY